MSSRAGQRRFTVLICAIVSLGPMGIAAVLPALPGAITELGGGAGGVEISLGAFTLGMSLGQILFGPISDRVGRRPPLIAGLTIFVVASIGVLAISSFGEFLVLRFVHGLANAAVFTLTRSIVRDVYNRELAAKMYGIMLVTSGGLTALSPLVGGWLTEAFEWRAIFFVLGIYGFVILAFMVVGLPETIRQKNPLATRVGPLITTLREIVRHKIFLAFLTLQLMIGGGLTVIIAGSSPAFISFFELSSLEYSLIIGGIFAMTMLGGLTVNRIVVRVGMIPVLMAGVSIMAFSALVGFGLSRTSGVTIIAVAIPLAIFILGLSLASPNTMAGAMSPFPDKAGTASTSFGFIQQLSNAGVGFLLGIAANGTPGPMMFALSLFGILALLVFILIIRPIAPQLTRSAEAP